MVGSKLKSSIKLALIKFFSLVERHPRRYDGAISTLYHEVGESAAAYRTARAVLYEQIAYLDNSNANWYTATELASHIGTCDAGNNICVTFDDGPLSAYQATMELADTCAKFTHFVIPGRIERNDKNTITWEQMRELDSVGVEIGSHSVTHPYLTRISDEQLRQELTDSKKMLEDKLGKPVTSFAYPYGEYNTRVVEMVKQAGYLCAYTTQHLYAEPGTDLFRIPRFEPVDTVQQITELCEGRAHLFYRLLGIYLGYRDARRA
jgi:peptidoglycan/xylan/chitin deacetylase (PgdA/CDA1 family)